MTVFAMLHLYPTGSGKTHTMMGETDRGQRPGKDGKPLSAEEIKKKQEDYEVMKGIIPRALKRMGEEKDTKVKAGWKFSMTVRQWTFSPLLLLPPPALCLCSITSATFNFALRRRTSKSTMGGFEIF